MEVFAEVYDFVQRLFSSLLDTSQSFFELLNTDVTQIIESWEGVGLVDDLLLDLLGVSDLQNVKLYMLMLGSGIVIYISITLIGWFWRLLPW